MPRGSTQKRTAAKALPKRGSRRAGKENASPRIGRPKGTGSQHVYDILRKRILSLEMPPGSGIDEVALVNEFGISRTPVREALIRLATDGFVTLLPNRGASVSQLDIDELPELLEALELCLRVTSRLAALRRTDADISRMRSFHVEWDNARARDDYLAMSEANNGLHLTIAQAARNRYQLALYQAILPQYYRLSVTLLSSAHNWARHRVTYFAELHDEHARLIAAIEARDSEAADRLAQMHATMIGDRLEAYIRSAFSHPIRLQDPQRRRIGSGTPA